MHIKIKVSILLISIFLSTFGVVSGSAQASAKITKIRAKVEKYGAGKKVSVTLTDGTKYKGRIKEISRNDFSVQARKTNQTNKFSYSEVAKIKKSSYTKWIIIGVVAGAVTAVMIPLSIRCRNESRNALCL